MARVIDEVVRGEVLVVVVDAGSMLRDLGGSVKAGLGVGVAAWGLSVGLFDGGSGGTYGGSHWCGSWLAFFGVGRQRWHCCGGSSLRDLDRNVDGEVWERGLLRGGHLWGLFGVGQGWSIMRHRVQNRGRRPPIRTL